MMLYENATVRFLWKSHHIPGSASYGCRVTIDESGVTEVIIPGQQKIVVTHIQNLVITTALEPENDGDIAVDEINPATIGDHRYCEICGQMVHQSAWDEHSAKCIDALFI